MQNYLDLLDEILRTGVERDDRTGVGTIGIYGKQLRYDLFKGFPLLTTKKIHLKSVIYELLWFLKGDTNIKYLNENGVSIWDEWADLSGDLGPIYGAQWRHWSGEVDQIVEVIQSLTTNPNSRRHIVSAWNVLEIPKMKLPPCHVLFQFHTERIMGTKKYRLHLQVYQRSCDVFLGVPFNIASYSLLLMMVAQVVGMDPGELIWCGGDVHIYQNHIEQVKEQLSRTPGPLPQMELNPEVKGLFEFEYSDFTLKNYDPAPSIKAPIAI